jgi:hypothetical protein
MVCWNVIAWQFVQSFTPDKNQKSEMPDPPRSEDYSSYKHAGMTVWWHYTIFL